MFTKEQLDWLKDYAARGCIENDYLTIWAIIYSESDSDNWEFIQVFAGSLSALIESRIENDYFFFTTSKGEHVKMNVSGITSVALEPVTPDYERYKTELPAQVTISEDMTINIHKPLESTRKFLTLSVMMEGNPLGGWWLHA